MKSHSLLLFFIFNMFSVCSQQPVPNVKGTSPLSTINQQLSNKTFAVVVGISDYQDPAIPDLRFADKDAEAFANYLRSAAGGKLDNDHLKVLINQQATMAQFANALDWLIENAKEGDQAIIYFSGHGDVEKKTLTQPGFLLCWDAPSRVYMAGGAFNLRDIQELVSTLSIQNKAKVIVITDACRSGTLAGSSVGGSQATAANLSKQFANEIKIMSCQPNEYSIEGEQWGGGRGAFSFHLIDALYGMADANNDQWVTLQEVIRYLEDHVSNEVAPISQVPMVIGNRNERLTSVDASLLASLRSGKTNQMAMLSPIESRGIEDNVLSGLDTTIKVMYQLFKKSLKDKEFLEPINACSDSYYEKLITEPKLEKLYSTMRRNYASALQDDAQQTLNKFLNGDPREITLSSTSVYKKYHSYPSQLEKAAALLGPHHYMYPILYARKYFFEGYILALINSGIPTEENGFKALSFFRQALAWQADLPNAYMGMAWIYGTTIPRLDSFEYYSLRAAELAPSWILPFNNLAFIYSSNLKKYDRAKFFLDKARDLDSNSTILLNTEGTYYYLIEQYPKAERAFKKAIRLDSLNIWNYVNLGNVFASTNRITESDQFYLKAIQLDSTQAIPYYNLACNSSIKIHINKAFEYLDLALKKGFNRYDFMQIDPDLKYIREQVVEWNSVIKKYFPEKIK